MVQAVTITGRLGGDAEQRPVGSDTVTSFNLAVDQGYGDKKVTNWFRVSVWGKKGAGAAPYLLKSGIVTVVGELEIGEYNGKLQLNVRAYDFTLPAKQQGERQQSSGNGNGGSRGRDRASTPNFGGGFDDDLDDGPPF